MRKNIWNTPVEWQGLSTRRGYSHTFLLCGSCFADRMGQKLQRSKFNAIVNPCGIAFDPLSLARHAEQALSLQTPTEADLIHHDGMWHSLQHHSSFSSHSKNETLLNITAGLQSLQRALREANIIIFTFGSAWYMERADNKQAIANAHKIPAHQFTKKLATVRQITESFSNVISQIREQNPAAEFIFSVSPVRYLRDGVQGNMRSKALLIESAHQICESFQQVHYFPAYEIVMDELRDYRWYTDDMLHISAMAVDYIWEKFQRGTMDEHSLSVMQKIESLILFTEHRPIHNTEEYNQQRIAKEKEIHNLIQPLLR